MKSRNCAIVGVLALIALTSAKAAEDLSSLGEPVAKGEATRATSQTNEPANKPWPAHVCAEIQRVEKVVISGARPTDRGMTRIGLLMLEQSRCGINVSKKIEADQAVLDDEQRKNQQDYEENIAAAQREALRPQPSIVIEVPQEPAQSTLPAPSPPVTCLTTRLVGGMSSTSCR
jgi:hypothetical protein